MEYWQIACGSQGRDYGKDFIRFGMAFVWGRKEVARMREVEVGDRVLMKRGVTKVVAAGEVVERQGKHRGENDKEWLRDFDGWDLSAYCFVDWHKPEKPSTTSGLTRSAIQKVFKGKLKEKADEIISNIPVQRSVESDPRQTRSIKDEEIVESLINQGLRPGAAEELTATFTRIRRLAQYYRGQQRWEDVREHETRTFLVVPLLLALGWAEQQIKIELPVGGGGRADVACFSKPFARETDECVLIVETKGFSQGLSFAAGQVKRYAKQFRNCRAIAVSNGYCYKTWIRQEDSDFEDKPSAYLNLLSPRDAYPLDPDHVKGCLEVLEQLLPSSWA